MAILFAVFLVLVLLALGGIGYLVLAAGLDWLRDVLRHWLLGKW